MNTCINCKYFPHTQQVQYRSKDKIYLLYDNGPLEHELACETRNPLLLKCQHTALACRITGEPYLTTQEARSPVIGGCGYEGRLFEQITPEESESRRQQILAQREEAMRQVEKDNAFSLECHIDRLEAEKAKEERVKQEIAAAAAKQKARILAGDPNDEVHSTTHAAYLASQAKASRKSWWKSLFQ